MSVFKESFFEASFKTIEEFDSAEVASAKLNVSETANLEIIDIKLNKSLIKTNQNKENNDGKEQQSIKKIWKAANTSFRDHATSKKSWYKTMCAQCKGF